MMPKQPPTGNHGPNQNDSGGTTALFGQAARAYLTAGWPSVLPLPPAAKWPPPEGYTGRQGAWPDTNTIDEWATSRPDGNLALRLPPDVIGIDVDAYGNKPGDQTLTELEDELGELPPTLVSTSRTDGQSGIRLYRTPQRPSWHDPGPGIEIIHSGWRYVIAAPSIHDKTGQSYKWIDQRTGEIRPGAPNVTDIADLPEAWADHLSSDQDNRKESVDPGVVRDWLTALPDGDEPCTAMRNTVDQFHRDLTAGGARHDAMLEATGRIVRAIDRGHQGGTRALTEARNAFLGAVTSDRSRSIAQAESEWQRALTGAYELVNASPTPDTDKGCRCRTLDTIPDPTTITNGARDREDGDSGPHIDPDAAQQIDERYPPLNWEQLWDAGLDDVEWIVEGLCETGRAAALFAPAKTGKSLFLLEMAACVATGQHFAGLPIPEPRPVVYIDLEMSPGDVIERLKTLGFQPHQLDQLIYVSLPALPPLDTDEGGRHLHAIATRHNTDLIVLDTASRVVEGPENDADTYRAYYQHTGQRLKRDGIAVWRLDHAGKNVGRGQRGSSSKNDDVDVVWKLSRRTGGRLILKSEMRRTLHGVDELHLNRDDHGRLHQVVFNDTIPVEDEIADAVDQLDQLDVPTDWGRRKVRSTYDTIEGSNEVLQAAINLRRERDRRPPEPTTLEGLDDD